MEIMVLVSISGDTARWTCDDCNHGYEKTGWANRHLLRLRHSRMTDRTGRWHITLDLDGQLQRDYLSSGLEAVINMAREIRDYSGVFPHIAQGGKAGR